MAFSQVLAVATLVGSIRYVGSVLLLFTNRIVVGLLMLTVPLTVSVFTAVNPALTGEFNIFIRMLVMALLIPLYVRSKPDLRLLLLVLTLSIGFVGTKYGLYGVRQGGVRFEGGYGGMLSDNNCLALGLVMGVPLCYYATSLVSLRWMKVFLAGVMFLNIAAIIMTYSRGAALSLITVFLFIAWYSKRKSILVLFLVLMTAPAVYLVGNSYLDRMQTISAESSDPSIQSRNEYRRVAFEMWKEYPFFGVGFGSENFMELSRRYMDHDDKHVVHNNYMQMLVDSGIFAFVIYVGLLFGCIFWLGRSARRIRDTAPELQLYPLAIQASLAGFAVGSFFLSRVSFDFVYILFMAAASWSVVEKEIVAGAATSDAPAQAVLA